MIPSRKYFAFLLISTSLLALPAQATLQTRVIRTVVDVTVVFEG